MTLFDEPIISPEDSLRDTFYTPGFALDPLLDVMVGSFIIWEPCCGDGSLVNHLLQTKHACFGSDLTKGQDFLNYEPEDGYDCIITNPPYSKIDSFLERAYSLAKPFAFLLPIDKLGGIARQDMYRKFGIEIIMLGRRINFTTPTGKTHGNGSNATFEVAWFTWGFNIGQAITFSQVEKQ